MSVFPLKNVSISLLDDHFLVLRGLSEVLNETDHFTVAGAFTTSKQLLKSLESAPVDVVIVDYELAPSDMDGLTLIKNLHRRHPAVAILVVSAHYNPVTVAHALRSGAKGFIGKNRPFEELQKAVLKVSQDHIYLEPEMVQQLASQQHQGEVLINGKLNTDNVKRATSLSSLSPKELEVTRHFLKGMTVTDIAEKFNRSIKTVSGQKQSAMRKLGLKADHELFIIKDELL